MCLYMASTMSRMLQLPFFAQSTHGRGSEVVVTDG
jgi:hypothetical protein